MASRPAKRQRRSGLVAPDDHKYETEHNASSLRASINAEKLHNGHDGSTSTPSTPRKRVLRGSDKTASPKASPSKARRPAKSNAQPPNKSLHSFFGKATEEQRWQRRSQTPDVKPSADVVDDDIVDDDSQDEILAHLAEQSAFDHKANESRAQSFDSQNKASFSSSQKFARPTVALRVPITTNKAEGGGEVLGQQPWADRYGPNDLGELAIHKKKASEVQKWLDDVFAGRDQRRLLILKGPAGTGKTSAVSLIAKADNVDVVAWHNPTTSDAGAASTIQQFEEFLSRGGQFEALNFQPEGPSLSDGRLSNKRLILVEEFPTLSNSSAASLNTFRSILTRYLASSSRSLKFGQSSLAICPPIVLVISETLISSSTAFTDSFTAHRLLGSELSHHPLTTTMEFNPVAATFVQKALELVIKKEARDSGRKRTPGHAVLQKLAEVGDLRSAINSLEFFLARGDNATDWSGTVAARARKNDKIALTEVEKSTLQLVSLRESTLDMFHAAGKIVYNKRDDPKIVGGRIEPPPRPPNHLSYLHKPKVSQVDVELLLNETGTDVQTFISTLHENYVLSCHGEDFVDAFDGCSQALSDSDILNPESRKLIRAEGNMRSNRGQAGNFETLRQEEISFQTATRGLLFCLPHPVNRAVIPGARKQDAFKMFYPASLRLWKPAEEVYDLISMFSKSELGGAAGDSYSTYASTGVASWKSKGFSVIPRSIASDDGEPISPPIILRNREVQVTEVLPYMARILTNLGKDITILNKITQMRGVHLLEDEEQFDEVAESLEAAQTSTGSKSKFEQRIMAIHDSMRLHGSFGDTDALRSDGKSKNIGNADESQMQVVEKLYISDDDIQDD